MCTEGRKERQSLIKKTIVEGWKFNPRALKKWRSNFEVKSKINGIQKVSVVVDSIILREVYRGEQWDVTVFFKYSSVDRTKQTSKLICLSSKTQTWFRSIFWRCDLKDTRRTFILCRALLNIELSPDRSVSIELSFNWVTDEPLISQHHRASYELAFPYIYLYMAF